MHQRIAFVSIHDLPVVAQVLGRQACAHGEGRYRVREEARQPLLPAWDIHRQPQQRCREHGTHHGDRGILLQVADEDQPAQRVAEEEHRDLRSRRPERPASELLEILHVIGKTAHVPTAALRAPVTPVVEREGAEPRPGEILSQLFIAARMLAQPVRDDHGAARRRHIPALVMQPDAARAGEVRVCAAHALPSRRTRRSRSSPPSAARARIRSRAPA